MTDIRESIWHRFRWLWILLGAIVAVGISMLLTRAGETSELAWCRTEYTRARTAADTATVDASIAPFHSAAAPARVACGVLRITGRL